MTRFDGYRRHAVITIGSQNVELSVDGSVVAAGARPDAGSDDQLEYLSWRLAQSLQAWQYASTPVRRRVTAANRTQTLLEVGSTLAGLILPKEVASRLISLLDEAETRGGVACGFAVESSEDLLQAMPLEAVVLDDRGPMCLIPAIDTYRVGGGKSATVERPDGPLRILAALADPLEADDAVPLRPDREREALYEMLADNGDHADLMCVPATVELLRTALEDGSIRRAPHVGAR